MSTPSADQLQCAAGPLWRSKIAGRLFHEATNPKGQQQAAQIRRLCPR